MLQIVRAVSGIIDRKWADVLIVLFRFVVARDIALAVRINDVPVARIGNYKTALAVAGWIPIFAADRPGIGAARDANVRVVLLRAINVIRKRVVDGYVIKLRGRLIVLRCPTLAAIDRNARTAVVRVADAIRILRINPQTVMIAMARGKQIKRFAAINRFER